MIKIRQAKFKESDIDLRFYIESCNIAFLDKRIKMNKDEYRNCYIYESARNTIISRNFPSYFGLPGKLLTNRKIRYVLSEMYESCL